MDILPVAAIVKSFIDAGIVPPLCRRVIIDLETGGVVKIYYEIFGDKKILDVMPEMLKRLPKLREPGPDDV